MVSAVGERVAPVQTIQPAHFPNVYATPNPSPRQIIFSVGAHHAVVEVELLEDVTGLALCIQRSMSTPVDVAAWPGCTYYFSVRNVTGKAVYTLNVTDVEGNVPYFVNLVLQSPGIETASAIVYMTLDLCPLGQTQAIDAPNSCVPVVPLTSDSLVPFNVPANTPQVTQYYTVTAPNNNPDNLVTGMDITLQLPQGTQWKFFAGANIPPTLTDYDFVASSREPEFEGGSFHISTPSPGVWYIVLMVTNDQNNDAYIGNISKLLEFATPAQIGPELTSDNRLQIGPDPNLPHTLRLYYIRSNDGSLYVSLSVLHPNRLETDRLPYKLFVAVNAVPGAFNNSIDSQGLNIFSDWTGCSLPASNCTKTTIIKMPPTGMRSTYVVAVLPSGNFTGSQFVLWRDSICPYCERGICQTSSAEFGTCKCPKGWIQIDCAKWGEKTLTPQTIVIISLMGFFAVFGVATLIYILYTKRAKLFPSKFGTKADGFERIDSSPALATNHSAMD
jgi:hypothetical protein